MASRLTHPRHKLLRKLASSSSSESTSQFTALALNNPSSTTTTSSSSSSFSLTLQSLHSAVSSVHLFFIINTHPGARLYFTNPAIPRNPQSAKACRCGSASCATLHTVPEIFYNISLSLPLSL